MNNDLLAGILGGLTGELPLSRPKNGTNSEPGDFMALLRDRLADESASSMSNETGKSGRSGLNAGIGAYNPLFVINSGSSDNVLSDHFKKEPVATGFGGESFQTKQSARLEDARSEQASAKAYGSRAESRKTDSAEASEKASKTEAEEADEDRAEKAAAEGAAEAAANVNNAVAAELNAKAEANEAIKNSELEKLLSAFSPEEKAALIEALQRLSPDDLEALAQSPDEFNQKLVELITEMPDSSAKDELLAMVESPEFLQLMQTVADLADQQAVSEDQMTSILTDQKAEQAASKAVAESDLATSQQDMSQNTAAATAAVEAAKADNNADNSAALQDGEEADESMANRKTVTRNTDEKNVEPQQESASAKPERSEESLREEFKRQNQSANEATSDNQQSETADEPVITNKSTAQTLTAQPATPEQAKATIEEAARKFFALFSEKSSGADKATGATTYSPETIKRHSNIGNSSAGNGGNGFSSHTGTPANSMSSTRPATPVPAANHIFSQMLEKAEYLKTQNGSKILNMEINPGELGKLEMELTSRDGTVSARISAESAMAKAQLDELAPQIKEQLINQGINLTEITVDISSKNPDERNRDQMSGGESKSSRILAANKEAAEAIIRKNILPNLRRAALNIKAVDLTV